MQFARNELDLIFDCDLDSHCAVVGDGPDYRIVNFPIADLAAIEQEMRDEGFRNVGSLAFRNGEVTLAPLPGGEVTLLHAAIAFLEANPDRMRRPVAVAGDSLAWLRTLYALPDTRGVLYA